MKTLVIGYGNPLRSDDGIGIWMAEEIARLNLPGVEVCTRQQLQVELVEECSAYDRIIFLDSSLDGEEFEIRRVKYQLEVGSATTHHLRIELLVSLAERLGIRGPEFYVGTLRCGNFEFGETISPDVLSRGRRAVNLVRDMILEGACHA